jgi:phage-related protein
MAGSRTLKLSILGDVDNLNKSLKTASGDVDSFGDKVGKAGVAIGKAFAAAAAAAGAAAIAIGIEGVKAAIADEKAQTQLALALENATGATQAQIKATEDSILKMSLATGVADDELRPALGRLVRSTGDTEKAQQLLAQALDISAATGKPVETVANSLAKAYDGNTTALGKLGVGLSTAELKTMSFEQVQGRLSELFGGAAARNADTYAGKIARVQVAFDEAKETVGAALLPILDKLLQFINQNALPAINAFSDAFSLTSGDGFGKVITDIANTVKSIVQPVFEAWQGVFEKLKKVIVDNKDNFVAFWDVIKYIAPLIGKAIGGAVTVIGDIAEVVLAIIAKVLGAIKPLLNFAIDGINAVIKGINLIKPGADIGLIPKIGTPATGTGALGNFSMSTGTTMTTPTVSAAGAATSTAGAGVTGVTSSAAAAGAAVSNIVSGNFNPGRFRAAEAASMGTTINLTVTGAFDREGTARTIVETLNDSFYRGTGGANSLQFA